MRRHRCVLVDSLQDFKYLRHFSRGTGYVLEFSARVGGASLVGVDLVEFDQDGKITDFMVIMRPAGAVQTLAGEWPSAWPPTRLRQDERA